MRYSIGYSECIASIEGRPFGGVNFKIDKGLSFNDILPSSIGMMKHDPTRFSWLELWKRMNSRYLLEVGVMFGGKLSFISQEFGAQDFRIWNVGETLRALTRDQCPSLARLDRHVFRLLIIR